VYLCNAQNKLHMLSQCTIIGLNTKNIYRITGKIDLVVSIHL